MGGLRTDPGNNAPGLGVWAENHSHTTFSAVIGSAINCIENPTCTITKCILAHRELCRRARALVEQRRRGLGALRRRLSPPRQDGQIDRRRLLLLLPALRPRSFRAFVSLAAYEVTTLPVWIANAAGSMFCVTGAACAFKGSAPTRSPGKIIARLGTPTHIQVLQACLWSATKGVADAEPQMMVGEPPRSRA